MWEAIASNRRRSALLIALMGMILAVLGFLVGSSVDLTWGGAIGLFAALMVWGVLYLTAVSAGSDIVLRSAGALKIRKEDAPRLWNVVEEMAIASGLASVPEVAIIESDAPNAFAVGQSPEKSSIAITSGLASRLSRDELQGVIAHEISHIRNQDTRFMTLASVMMGSIVLISDLFLRSLRWGGMRRRTGRGGGQAQALLLVAGLAASLLAPLFAQLLYFACSRRREYLADASAARFTRYPDGLASALEKIAVQSSPLRTISKSVAPLFIVNPLQSGAVSGWLSTHPPTETRIRILRSMGGRAGYVDYEAAYRRLQGEGGRCLGPGTLATETSLPARSAAGEVESRQEAVDRVREVSDLMASLGGYLLLPCRCGVRIKVPPGSKIDSVACPRCGAVNLAPAASAAVGSEPPVPQDRSIAGEGRSAGSATAPLRYVRKVKGWESFRCACGKTVQISPVFAASHVQCGSCRRRIEIQ